MAAILAATLSKNVYRASVSGKSGGFRTIIVYCAEKKAFFVYGFPKSAQDNIDDADLKEYRKMAQLFLGLKDTDIRTALRVGELKEIEYNEKVSG